MKSLKIVLAVAMVLALSGPAWAATYTFDDGGADSKWITAANWDPDTGPPTYGGADPAIIDAAYTVTIGAGENAEGRPLTLSGTVDQTGGTCKVLATTINATGTYNLDAGTYNFYGTNKIYGALNVGTATTSGTVNGSGGDTLIYNGGVLNLTKGSVDIGYLKMTGGATGATINIGSGTTFESGGTLGTWGTYMRSGDLINIDGTGSTVTFKGFFKYDTPGATMQFTAAAGGVTTANVVAADAAGGTGDVDFGTSDGTIKVVDDNVATEGDHTLLTWTGTETGTPVLDLPTNWTWKNEDDWEDDNAIVVNVEYKTFVWDDGGADNRWVTAANWAPDGLPTYSGDNVTIGAGNTATIVTGDAAQTGPMYLYGTVNQTGGTNKTLGAVIRAGGTYNMSGGIYNYNGTSKVYGDFNISGGDVLGGGGATIVYSGNVNLSSGSLTMGKLYVSGSNAPTFHITGGTFYSGGALAGWTNSMGDSLFHVDGSDSTITFELNLDLSGGATLQFTITDSGITTVNVVVSDYAGSPGTDGDIIFGASAIKVLDDSAAAGDYTLLTWAGSETGTPTFDLPDGDWSWKNSDSWATDNYIEVTKVPEPATMTLLLLGLPFALRRRRR